jgi:superfamily II DNA or RNA helicase
MKTAHIWVKDEVWMVINGLDPSEITFLWNKFAFEVPGSFFMPARKFGGWSGKQYFFDKTGKVYLRLLDEILPFIQKWGYEIELHDERRPVKSLTHRLTETWFIDRGKAEVPIKLRPYQVQAVNTAVEEGSGACVMATGAGKSLCIAGMCDIVGLEGLRSIVIVPSADLVQQTSNTFKLVGIEHGVYSGAEKNIYAPHVIATWQSLQNNPVIMENFDSVIVDECHGGSAKIINDLVTNHAKHAPYRFGFTGTWPKEEIHQYTLRGSIGNIIYEINAADLIEMGYLSKLEIQPIEIQENAVENFPDYASEKTYTSKSPERLDFIADLIIDKTSKHGNTLVIVNSIKQGQQLQKLIKDSVFLQGSTENEVRAEWYSTFEHQNNLIVIATVGIAGTGISIDRIFHLCMIDAGKSFTRCLQILGRGIRKGHDKDFVHVTDMYSSLKFSKKHAKERAKFYKEASYPVLKVIKAKL